MDGTAQFPVPASVKFPAGLPSSLVSFLPYSSLSLLSGGGRTFWGAEMAESSGIETRGTGSILTSHRRAIPFEVRIPKVSKVRLQTGEVLINSANHSATLWNRKKYKVIELSGKPAGKPAGEPRGKRGCFPA